jgi:hypothetical protein
MTDQQIELIIKVGILVGISAFWPWISKWLHKIGYRDWRNRDKKE